MTRSKDGRPDAAHLRACGRLVPWLLATLLLVAPGSAAAAQQAGAALSQEEAIRLAREHAPAVAAAARELAAAELALTQAENDLTPRLSLDASTTLRERRASPSVSMSAGGRLGERANWNLLWGSSRQENDGLRVSVDLWPPAGPSQGTQNLTSAELRLARAEGALGRARDEAAIAALEAYRRLQFAQVRADLARVAYEEAVASLAITRENRAAGRASESEVLRAEITAMEREASVTSRAAQLEAAREQLAALVGRDAASLAVDPFDADEVTVDERWTVLPPLEEAVRLAVDRSDSVAEALRNLEAARKNLQLAEQDNGLEASANARLSPTASGGLDWSVTISGTYSLTGGAARKSRVELARLAVERATLEYEASVSEVEAVVRDALRGLEDALRTVRLRESQERLALLDVMAAREQAERGFLTQSALEASERAFASASVDRAEAVTAFLAARLRFELLLGRALPEF